MSKPPERNPVYIKIGKRIRQARLMAKETNSRALSERLGWSGGRINNFETGTSTPGVEETLQLCEALGGVNPCWVTYGVGSPRPAQVLDTRYRNLMAAISEAETAGDLPELLTAMHLTVESLEKLRANPLKKIPDRQARRCEKHLGKPRGWLDQGHVRQETFPDDFQELLEIYEKFSSAEERRKLFALIDLLLGDPK